MKQNRRDFVRTLTAAGSALYIPFKSYASMTVDTPKEFSGNALLSLSFELLQSWCNGLMDLQISDPKMIGLNGGVVCPACSRVHGRTAYAIYPLMLLADKTQNMAYRDSALAHYTWMEKHVSFPDGSWVNDSNVNLWKGITVCTAITLAKTLMEFPHMLDKQTYALWRDRLVKSADYLYDNFNIYTGNINYPATCSYALAIIGEFLDVEKYKVKSKQLGDECKAFFSENDHLLFGEGKPQDMISPKGCRFVDLGYNVEESLPSLVMYGKFVRDEEMLQLVTRSLKAHAQFMLPDGAWDNSWGSRSFKWAYWGGTTSDGCQHAYALLADREPAFYNVALQNARLQKQCTHQNVLYGGLHTKDHGLLPCVHPTFTHVNAMATVLGHAESIEKMELPEKIELPRDTDYGVKTFKDIQTWLISKHGWKGTITAYDMDYERITDGHPSGGALSMLWHEKTGPLFTASMNGYQLIEAANMQMHKDALSMPLTPRVEMSEGGNKYMSLYDKKAVVDYFEKADELVFKCTARLLNNKEEEVPGGNIECQTQYIFRKDEIVIKVSHNAENKAIKFVAPVISANSEAVLKQSATELHISKPRCKVLIETNNAMHIVETEKGRMFNFIPGIEALPLEVGGQNIEIKIKVI